jgi:hypothetical protein
MQSRNSLELKFEFWFLLNKFSEKKHSLSLVKSESRSN